MNSLRRAVSAVFLSRVEIQAAAAATYNLGVLADVWTMDEQVYQASNVAIMLWVMVAQNILYRAGLFKLSELDADS